MAHSSNILWGQTKAKRSVSAQGETRECCCTRADACSHAHLVHARVANEAIDGLGELELFQLLAELPH